GRIVIKKELRLGVDEMPDQPGGGDAVNSRTGPRDPLAIAVFGAVGSRLSTASVPLGFSGARKGSFDPAAQRVGEEIDRDDLLEAFSQPAQPRGRSARNWHR